MEGVDSTFPGRGVLVVEDNRFLCELVAGFLREAKFDVYTAHNAAEAKQQCDRWDPDALLLDVELGSGPDGFHVAEALYEEGSRAVVFMTNMPDIRFAQTTPSSELRSRAAYLNKNFLEDGTPLLEALHATLRNQVSPAFRHDLLPDRPLMALSTRQLSVLKLVSEGWTNQQIAAARSTSVRAVEAMISRLLTQIGLDAEEGNSRVRAGRAYIQATSGSYPLNIAR